MHHTPQSFIHAVPDFYDPEALIQYSREEILAKLQDASTLLSHEEIVSLFYYDLVGEGGKNRNIEMQTLDIIRQGVRFWGDEIISLRSEVDAKLTQLYRETLHCTTVQEYIDLLGYDTVMELVIQKRRFFKNMPGALHLIDKVAHRLRIFLSQHDRVDHFYKSGSELVIFRTRGMIALAHTLSSGPAQIWKMCHDGNIPVAPIYSMKRLPGEKTRVISRLCGEAIRDTDPVLMYIFEDEIYDQTMQIHSGLFQYGVDHGHCHSGNYVVEWVEKKYLDAHASRLNTMEWDQKYFTSSSTVLSYTEDGYRKSEIPWSPLVRLIDWDAAQLIIP